VSDHHVTVTIAMLSIMYRLQIYTVYTQDTCYLYIPTICSQMCCRKVYTEWSNRCLILVSKRNWTWVLTNFMQCPLLIQQIKHRKKQYINNYTFVNMYTVVFFTGQWNFTKTPHTSTVSELIPMASILLITMTSISKISFILDYTLLPSLNSCDSTLSNVNISSTY